MAKEEKPVTSKHKTTLELWCWKKEGEEIPEKRPLDLATKDGGLHTGLMLRGTVDLEKDELYDILRGEMEDGKLPLFLMRLQ